MFAEFFADDDEKTGNRVDKTMDGVGGDGERISKEADDDIENAEEEIGGDETVAAFFDSLATSEF